MVGTAYRAPEPGAARSSRSAHAVARGRPSLIIEAMKTMNQIPAHRSGTVKPHPRRRRRSPVEYGEPLVVIE
jgi:acetyl-CoA carboxylase biotin carboxyl carrier protein